MQKVESISNASVVKSIIYTSLGIFIFFIPIKIDSQSKTFLYHLGYSLQNNFLPIIKLSIIVFSILGIVKSIISYEKKIIIYIMSLIFLINIFYGGKNFNVIDDSTIFFIEETILNIATIFPLSAIFLVFLDYGFIDIVESYFQKPMKKIYKMSGKTVVNILIYIFTDCFCGYYATNRMYKKGLLRENEAFMLFLNFSVASIWTFNYVSDELNLSKLDLFIKSAIMMILINIIMSRINNKKKTYFIKTNYKETIHRKHKFKKGLNKYLNNNMNKNIFKEIIINLEDSFEIITYLILDIVFVLSIGSILMNLDSFFTNDMYKFIYRVIFNNILAIENVSGEYSTRLDYGIICIIMCISSNLIYMKYTDIKLKFTDILLCFIERTILILSLLIFVI